MRCGSPFPLYCIHFNVIAEINASVGTGEVLQHCSEKRAEGGDRDG